MNRDTYDALPVGTELFVRSACPECGVRGQVEVTIKLIVDEDASLSGSQMKVSAHKGAVFTCGNCGATGDAEPKLSCSWRASL